MSENNSVIINSLKKSFCDKVVFNGLSLSFKGGIVYLISGSNGVGKTTLFRMISGLDTSFEGEISVSGKIAVAFQEHRLFTQVSAISNVSVTASSQSEARAYLERFGFTENDMRKRAKYLSGGQKQMCSLSRAFASDRDIILLDEPGKELDAKAKSILWELISEKKRDGKLIIVISHDDEDLSAADEIIRL